MPQTQPWRAFWIFYLLTTLWMWLTVPSYAQTQPSPNATYTTTSNLLDPTVSSWTGTVQGQNAGTTGGSTPAFNPSTNTIIFGYTMATATQIIAINQALSGTGIQVGGYNYSWNINNDPATGQYGTLSGNVLLRDAGGNVLQTYSYNYPQQSGGFINFSGTQWFPQDYSLSNLSNLEVSFTGQDATFWAGYYGPQVRNPSLSLQYTVDQCVVNPQSSPSCPGYKTYYNMWDDGYAQVNLPFAFPFYGQTFTTSYMFTNGVVGFLNTNLLGYCCDGTDLNQQVMNGGASWNFAIYALNTDLYPGPNSQFYTQQTDNGTGLKYTWENVAEIATANESTFSVNIKNSGYIGINYEKVNLSPWRSPLIGIAGDVSQGQYSQYYFGPASSLPNLAGITLTYTGTETTDICAINPLYNTSCPGYQQAYFTQECTVSALFDPTCPGYAAAYLTYQCNIDQLYSPSCPGYQQAYFDQQCTADPLYDRYCPGYNTAYATQQNTQTNSPTTTSSTTTSSVSLTGTVSTTEPTLTIATNGTVTTGVAIVSDSEVNAVITKKVETTASPTGTLSIQIQTKPAESEQQKKGREATAAERELALKEEKKREEEASDRRKQLAERQRRAAIENVVARGREAIREADSAKTMDEQMANQSYVVATMSFVPGFEAYGQARLPDAQFYAPREIYRGQQNVDNQRLLRGLTGASDQRHADMVNSQHER